MKTFVANHRRLLLLFASAAVAAAAVTGFLAERQARGGRAYTVRIAPELQLRLTPDQVAAMVLQRLGPKASIDTIDAVADEAAIENLEPRNGLPNPVVPQQIGPLWLVRAHGRFVGRHTPPGVPDVTASSGYFVIDDRTGEVVDMGMP